MANVFCFVLFCFVLFCFIFPEKNALSFIDVILVFLLHTFMNRSQLVIGVITLRKNRL